MCSIFFTKIGVINQRESSTLFTEVRFVFAQVTVLSDALVRYSSKMSLIPLLVLNFKINFSLKSRQLLVPFSFGTMKSSSSLLCILLFRIEQYASAYVFETWRSISLMSGTIWYVLTDWPMRYSTPSKHEMTTSVQYRRRVALFVAPNILFSCTRWDLKPVCVVREVGYQLFHISKTIH